MTEPVPDNAPKQTESPFIFLLAPFAEEVVAAVYVQPAFWIPADSLGRSHPAFPTLVPEIDPCDRLALHLVAAMVLLFSVFSHSGLILEEDSFHEHVERIMPTLVPQDAIKTLVSPIAPTDCLVSRLTCSPSILAKEPRTG